MTPDKARALLEAIDAIRSELPFVGTLIDSALPAAIPFVAGAESILSKIFAIGSVYLTKQGGQAEDEIRARLLAGWSVGDDGTSKDVELEIVP